MVATDHRTDGVHEVGEAPDHYRLFGSDAGAVGQAAQFGVEVGGMGLVGRQARPGDVKHINSVDLAASPEPGPGEPDPFLRVSPDLLTMGEAMGVAHGHSLGNGHGHARDHGPWPWPLPWPCRGGRTDSTGGGGPRGVPR